MSARLRIGTRGSELALFQANAVADLLRLRAGAECEIVVIKTSGDALADAPLSEIGGKRLFVKELEDALLAADVQLAVHSSKDMPALLPTGLEIGAVLPREDPRDAVVMPDLTTDAAIQVDPLTTADAIVRRIGEAARIGTSSIRRTAQLRRLLPRATFASIRGNLGTRLRKLDEGQFDALILAAAGLRRLGKEARISGLLPAASCVPAPGQGIIAVEIRSADTATRERVLSIDDPTAAAALLAERTVVEQLGGGCQMPIGAYAAVSGDALILTAIVLSADGGRAATAEQSGAVTEAAAVGMRAAQELLAGGAREILEDVERLRGGVEGLQP